MVGISPIYLVTFVSAMIRAASAVTAREFRRMSNLQSPRDLLALQAAPGMSPVRVQTWHTRWPRESPRAVLTKVVPFTDRLPKEQLP